ncbi:MAG TPA: SH3 domain-containing protein [Polyangiaceae bacterium]|jgi:hypothetical protein|nr:SH3 domain-containing protein [Polyangiaceae bacterium]
MKHHDPRHRITTFVIVLGGLVALVGTGALAAHEVGVATAEARGLVQAAAASPPAAPGPADVLALERARLLAPRADFVRSALAAEDARVAVAPLARAVGVITPVEWSYLTLASGWAAGIALAVVIGSAERRRWARRLVAVASVALSISLAGFLESNSVARALAVVTGHAGLLVAPYDGAGATADLTPGVVVVRGARYGDFVQVHGTDGTSGWISTRALQPVVEEST